MLLWSLVPVRRRWLSPDWNAIVFTVFSRESKHDQSHNQHEKHCRIATDTY